MAFSKQERNAIIIFSIILLCVLGAGIGFENCRGKYRSDSDATGAGKLYQKMIEESRRNIDTTSVEQLPADSTRIKKGKRKKKSKEKSSSASKKSNPRVYGVLNDTLPDFPMIAPAD